MRHFLLKYLDWKELTQVLFTIQSVVNVSPEVLVGPLDPEHVTASIVLVQVTPNQRAV